MLDVLLGSKSAERVLLFLLVNGFSCVSDMQKAFDATLAPLQSMVQKLERGGIIVSKVQGRKKLFQLDPAYPLHSELKNLLKTAFVHLPASEKKVLFSCQLQESVSSLSQKKISSSLLSFWKRLQKVDKVSIQTQTGERAFGKVLVTQEKEGVLLFTEQGQWVEGSAQEIHFSKVLRWTLDYSAGVISLEHLHYGVIRPVFLFHLAPKGAHILQSIDSHLCLSDCYFGRVTFNNNNIEFLWRIIGPRKNEVLYHVYS